MRTLTHTFNLITFLNRLFYLFYIMISHYNCLSAAIFNFYLKTCFPCECRNFINWIKNSRHISYKLAYIYICLAIQAYLLYIYV